MAKSNERKDNSTNTKRTHHNNYKKDKSRSSSDRIDRGLLDRLNRACNDVSWYANSEQLLKDTASLAYSQPLGIPFNLDETAPAYYSNPFGDESANSWVRQNETVPGIMALYCDLSVGRSEDRTSPINIAARNLYSFVRHQNSGHTNYEATDMMMYVIAMDNLYSVYAFLARAYGTMSLYSQSNRYYPRAMIKAMGLNFEDLQANIADFRAFINTVAYKLGVMCVPSSMTYMKRHQWMYSNYFVDSAAKKPQTYLYTPYRFWKYSGFTNEKGGELIEAFKIGGGTTGNLDANEYEWTFDRVRDEVNSMLNAVLEDEDMNIMSGDILKAFGADSVVKIATIPENFAVYPSYSLEVLSQIQNATIVGQPSFTKITQDPIKGIVCVPTVSGGGLMGDRIISMYKDDVTPGDTMVATRMTVFAEKEEFNGEQPSWKTYLDSVGSDYVVRAAIISFRRDDKGELYLQGDSFKYVSETVRITDMNPSVANQAMQLMVNLNLISLVNHFAYHPTYRICHNYLDPSYLDAGVTVPLVTICDTENYTILKAETQRNMNQTALLSMFAVPAMGAWNSKTN